GGRPAAQAPGPPGRFELPGPLPPPHPAAAEPVRGNGHAPAAPPGLPVVHLAGAAAGDELPFQHRRRVPGSQRSAAPVPPDLAGSERRPPAPSLPPPPHSQPPDAEPPHSELPD